MKEIKDFALCTRQWHYLKTCFYDIKRKYLNVEF